MSGESEVDGTVGGKAPIRLFLSMGADPSLALDGPDGWPDTGLIVTAKRGRSFVEIWLTAGEAREMVKVLLGYLAREDVEGVVFL
jgi:predicted acylesterase/phospholipase RssA